MCEITIQVNCPYCHGVKVVKNGLKKTGRQNFMCRVCGKQFQREYQYVGCKPESKVPGRRAAAEPQPRQGHTGAGAAPANPGGR